MTQAAQRIRDAAIDGDFIRASALWQRYTREITLTELPELIAVLRQSAAGTRAQAWVARAYGRDQIVRTGSA